ncbi:glutamine-hydrolyzing GMP synthase [Pseudomonadota bacterium]
MDKIAVLDFGGQYAHLIANRVRRLGVYSEIIDPSVKASDLKDFKGIIFSGGPQSVYDKDAITADPKIFKLGIPILGICYGHQLVAKLLGGKVESTGQKEYGLSEVEVKKKEGIFWEMGDSETAWMSHGDSVTNLPRGYEVIGSTKDGECAAIADFKRNFFGIQFHLEVTHTVQGMKMLENFLNVCGVSKDWSIQSFADEEIEIIKEQVGDKKVFMLVSGGVDSTVAFVLLTKALGANRVYGLFVDTGFLRKDERDKVEKSLKSAGFENLHTEDASDQYFEALKGVYEPEKKRLIIGDLFLKVQKQVVEELELNPEEWLLGQGTIYPDTIESGGTKHAAKIKTHHNRVPEIEELIKQGRIIEPIAQLYKDEVREVGKILGLSEKLVWRHPFPGPGLAVRCLCAKEESYPESTAEIEDVIYSKQTGKKMVPKILPIQSVGVQGDFRTYRNPLALIPVDVPDIDFKELDKVATDLINQSEAINRVVVMLAPDKIESIFVKNAYLERERIALLQEADDIVSAFIEEKGLSRKIWQFPTVLIPMSINEEVGESIVLRPVESEEAMTASFFKMKIELLEELTGRLKKVPGISAVFYDITNKPPGTIEWE